MSKSGEGLSHSLHRQLWLCLLPAPPHTVREARPRVGGSGGCCAGRWQVPSTGLHIALI